MKFRQWYLGIAAAGAAVALAPIGAHANSIPNLLYGGQAIETNAEGTGMGLSAHFNGVTSETPAVANEVQGVNNGGSCSGGICTETTWGIGVISQIVPTRGGNATWNEGDQGSSIAYVLYGAADQSVTIYAGTGTGFGGNGVPVGSYGETITQAGATASNSCTVVSGVCTTGSASSIYGNTNGSITLDLYYMPVSDTPCFTVGCGPNFVSAADRTGNTAAGVAQVTGITNVGTLFASFSLQPGVSSDGSVTLSQQLSVNNSTGQINSNGGSANFFAECYLNSTPGPGCSQFAPVAESILSGGSFDPNTITQIFGQIGDKNAQDLANSNLPTWCFNSSGLVDTSEGGPSCTTGPGNGQKTSGNLDTSGYLISTTDPVNFVAGAVPEPASLGLLGTGLALFGVAIGRRRRKGISA